MALLNQAAAFLSDGGTPASRKSSSIPSSAKDQSLRESARSLVGLPNLPAKGSYSPCSEIRERCGQVLGIRRLSSAVGTVAPCILAKSPCISQKCRERRVRDRLRPPPSILVSHRSAETCRICPPLVGFFYRMLSLQVSRTAERPISRLCLRRGNSRSWRRKGVVQRTSPRSCRCCGLTGRWSQGCDQVCARPSRSNWTDHSAGASRKFATPMPRGSRPSTAALTRPGAINAIEMVMLTWRTLHL